ncbi:regucalcin [Apis florea]|uniref:regucalcin n=1 Tax=Apis florea TaxID=7463 RepID=UPI000252BB76|nr:regucalcin [Apis florea]
MSDITLEPLVGPYDLGEGPHWDSISQKLYYVDIYAQKVFRFDPASGIVTSVFIENGPVGFVVPVEGCTDKFVAGCGIDFVLFSWNSEKSLENCIAQILISADSDRIETRLNDGKVDSSGRLWAGTMGHEKNGIFPPNVGSLYSIGNDFKLKKQISPVSISNGLAWNPNNDIFYYIDSLSYQIMAYNYNSQTGIISNKKIVFDFLKNNIPGLPDGMTIDTNGNLWVAVYGGGGILNINPKTGELLRFVKINNAKNITSVAFGGPNLDILYVTSARTGLNENQLKEQLHAGYLFAIKGLGVCGFPANSFKLPKIN